MEIIKIEMIQYTIIEKLTEKFSKAASTNNKRVHIVPSKDGWSVKKEGSTRSTAVMPTKEGAIEVAKHLKSIDRIILHKKDGTIQKNIKRNNHGSTKSVY
jgi:hypothetical protein